MSRTIWLAPLLATTLVAQSFTVTGVTPARRARGVSPAANVTLAFDATVDPLTVLPQNLFVEGRYSGPVPGNWAIGPGGISLTFTPARPYFASETVTIRVSRFLRSAAGVALAGGFYSTFSADAAARAATASNSTSCSTSACPARALSGPTASMRVTSTRTAAPT